MLRYPGGKLRLMPRINDLIKELYGGYSFMEPWVCADVFTGGGGSLIRMAEDFSLWTFHLNDLNPVISSFWKFFQNNDEIEFKELYRKIRGQKVSISTYKEMLSYQPQSLLDNAFKIIFLNKTSFGGMVEDCAPIGGYEQKAEWHVDEFWKPETIIRGISRVRRVLKNRILSVSMEDFEPFINKTRSDFYYCDPPYIANGQRWYSCNFNFSCLSRLKSCLLNKDKWCVSIDRSPETESLFSDCNLMGIDVTHTSRSSYISNKKDSSIKNTSEIVAFPKNTIE